MVKTLRRVICVIAISAMAMLGMPSTATAAIPENQWAQIWSPGQYWECLSSSSPDDGSPVYVTPCDSAPVGWEEQWVTTQVSPGVYLIANRGWGKCLDANPGGYGVTMFTCYGGVNQQWGDALDGRLVSMAVWNKCLTESGQGATYRVTVEVCGSGPNSYNAWGFQLVP